MYFLLIQWVRICHFMKKSSPYWWFKALNITDLFNKTVSSNITVHCDYGIMFVIYACPAVSLLSLSCKTMQCGLITCHHDAFIIKQRTQVTCYRGIIITKQYHSLLQGTITLSTVVEKMDGLITMTLVNVPIKVIMIVGIIELQCDT